MQNILRQNHDIFAWAHSDMKGSHPSIASHRLNVFSTARPVRQRIRRFHPERQRVIRNEIDKLLEVGFIREVSYPDWLANVVVRDHHHPDSPKDTHDTVFLPGPPQGKANDVSTSPIQRKSKRRWQSTDIRTTFIMHLLHNTSW
ncbi:hypothetical protein CK203_084102 [Vitis vinifera]|uniref:Uncharacterized protein n=1 Tax=Vitis vinifera TaxID=29760 RepID=A0A438FK59_VITVI|nr:hypothetical protein CK203_084102 [Vitis vinifera]